MNPSDSSSRCLTLLSQALFQADVKATSATAASDPTESLRDTVSGFTSEEFSKLWSLATSHHVIMRAFLALSGLLGPESDTAEWMDRAIVKEQKRTYHALSVLAPVCDALEETGDVIVIKSLDHWPDLGSDLDLYTNANAADVVALMRDRFKAEVAARSWGDRLANKWNFVVPGLPELVEIHIARLGQTGEQIAITESLIARSVIGQFGPHTFRVPAPEDRIVISTLQRMYRHFYIRLCDIVDNAKLIDSRVIDYPRLRSLAKSAGLWDGLATYLVIVSGYVDSYRGIALPLPALVTEASRFGNELIRFKRNFLRVPLFPQAMSLYLSEWKRLLMNGEIQNTLRLSLLPGLATAAAVELKLTGSDKGIW